MTRSNRHGIRTMPCCLPLHGHSHGALCGGTLGTGILGITGYHGTGTRGTAGYGGIPGIGIRGIGTLGTTDLTGDMTRTGITITGITTIPEYGITITIRTVTSTMVPEIPPVLSARGVRRCRDQEVPQAPPYPETCREFLAVRQLHAVPFQD